MLSATDDISSGNSEAQSLAYLIESPYVMKDNKHVFTYLKFFINEYPIKKYHDYNGVVFMNIYDSLIDGYRLNGL